MFDKILNTFLTRAFSMVVMFLVVIINTNTFGAEGTGTIALVILGLTLLQVLSNFVGGTSLVYLTPQRDNAQLVFLSYGWALFSNLAGLVVLYFLNLVPHQYIPHLLILTLIYSAYYIHTGVMQGREEIKQFNMLQLTQVLILVLSLSVEIFICRKKGIPAKIDLYFYSFILSYLVPAVISGVHVFRTLGPLKREGLGALLREMIGLGFWIQMANLAQLLTYRLNYYFIEGFVGRKSLGIYELGTRISEAVWIFPKSICLVQYARISNCHEEQYAKQLTLGLLKIVFVFSLAAVLVLWALPAEFIAWVFGPDFFESKSVICSLLPGIVSLSCLSVLAHHFAGYGKYWINAVGSLIGLAVTAIFGLLLLPGAAETSHLLVLRTAGWISSGAYTASLLFTLICFIRFTSAKGHDFLITRSDWALLKEVVTEKFSNFRKKSS